jgi:uncharacterized protein
MDMHSLQATRLPRVALVLALFPLTSACGLPNAQDARPPSVNGMVDPNDTTSGSASTGSPEPLLVDWPATARANLEVAMHDGIAIVAYAPSGPNPGVKLLPNCSAPGNYGYVGTSVKEQVVRLESADELKANLPLGGLGIAAKLGADFQKGAVVDVAMMMVGKFRTTKSSATKSELKGECKGATHMVRGAIAGAFAVEKGTKVEAKAAAEVFGAGVGGKTGNSSDFKLKDGNVAACQKADPSASAPPTQCAALIRLDLVELTP